MFKSFLSVSFLDCAERIRHILLVFQADPRKVLSTHNDSLLCQGMRESPESYILALRKNSPPDTGQLSSVI